MSRMNFIYDDADLVIQTEDGESVPVVEIQDFSVDLEPTGDWIGGGEDNA